MADSKKYNGSTWEHSLRKLGASTDTITILPVDLYADGTNATVGLVGNMQQTGTPTPSSPIQPSECGERTGNLFDKTATNVNNGYIRNGFLQSDGIITTNNDYRVSEYIRIAQNQSYTVFYGSNLNLPSVCFYDSAKNYISGIAYAGQWSVPFTTPQNAEYLRLSFRAVDPALIMLNTGSVTLPYEPYGYKIPISSASTTTPVYLGEVESTRRIKKLVLTGEETVRNVGGNAPYLISAPGLKIPTLVQVLWMCSHYQAVPSAASWSQYNSLISWNGTDGATLRFRDTSKADVNAFKAFLSSEYSNGTPVTIWYVLETEETGIVNEPLMKIGNYADTVSGITIPTIAGANSFDVLTTLKPSEVSLSYTGWHDASVKEWDGSQWQ